MLVRQRVGVLAVRLAVAVRILEEARPVLGAEHAPHGPVDRLFVEPPVPRDLREHVAVDAAHHVDVDARAERLHAGLGFAGSNAVLDQLAHARVVAHEQAVPAPLVTEHAVDETIMRVHRDAVHFVEGGHDARRARVGGGPERRQEDFAERAPRKVHGVVIAPGLRRAVAHVVLGRGKERARIAQVVALKAFYAGARHHRRQVRILAEALHDAPPARLARHVQHGRKRPMHAGSGRLCRAHPRGAARHRRVPAARHRQRHREDRAEAVHHVVGKQQRNAETRLLDGHALQAAGFFRAVDVQKRPDGPVSDQRLLIRARLRPGGCPLARVLRELAQLFLNGHLRQERVDARRWRGLPSCDGCADRERQQQARPPCREQQLAPRRDGFFRRHSGLR